MRNEVRGLELEVGKARNPRLKPPVSGAVVGDFTEADLIARIQQQLPPAPDWLLVGIGDDAAVVEPERNRVQVLTVDALVEGVHFDRRYSSLADIGYRALAVNVSAELSAPSVHRDFHIAG